MKQQVLFVHGANAYSEYEAFLNDLRTVPLRDLPDAAPLKKWTSTLVEDLGETYQVFTPSMPNKQNAKYGEWKIWFERYFEHLQDEVILVGWSQGGVFLVKYLLENEVPFTVKKLILAAAPFERAVFGDEGEDGGDFFFDQNQVGDLVKKVGKIVIFHSADDFVVPFAHGVKYHTALPEAEFVRFTNKNHFLIEKFPELLEEIRKS